MEASRSRYPFPYRVANALGKLLVAAKLPVMRLDETTLRAAAMKQTGLNDFGDPYHRKGLLRLLESAEQDAKLHPLGRFMFNNFVTNYLAQRLRLVAARTQQPEIFQEALRPPLIICGLARSGTTFLHRMLACNPAYRALPLWLLMRPFPESQNNGASPDPRIKKMEQTIRVRGPLLPGMDAMHYQRADTTEECIVALGLTFNSLIFSTIVPVYGYTDWFLQYEDTDRKYREYRWLLQVFQAQDPARKLTLKAPAHTGNLEALSQAIPEAMLIQTHREPATCVSSACSLVASYYRAASNEVDVSVLASKTLRLYESWCRRSIAFREAHPGMVYDVFYDDLVADPVGTVRGVYNHFGLPWSAAYASALEAYVHGNPKNKHGKHQYKATDFGLSEAEIADRLGFYSEHFGLNRS